MERMFLLYVHLFLSFATGVTSWQQQQRHQQASSSYPLPSNPLPSRKYDESIKPPRTPTVEEFTNNLKLHAENQHRIAQQHAREKQIRHYNVHTKKAHQLYNAHVQSIEQKNEMKRRDPSLADAVDVYYNTLQSEYNVHKCFGSETLLHADRVNDGTCDCCDGSDEPEGACRTGAGSRGELKRKIFCQLSKENKEKRLIDWMTKNDITGLAVPNFVSNSRGMKALQNISPGDVILRVPIKLSIYKGNIPGDVNHVPLPKQSKDSILTTIPEIFHAMEKMLTPNAYVAMLLLHQMNTRKNAWLESLPTYVKSIFHTSIDWSWMQQQSPSTDLLIQLSNKEQSEVRTELSIVLPVFLFYIAHLPTIFFCPFY
jgi:hypothetical protein